MSRLSNFIQALLKRGFKFSWSGDWLGEGKLSNRNYWPKTPTNEDIRKEIQGKLNKKKGV